MRLVKRRRNRPITLDESLYYAVREAFNCQADPAYREADELILAGLNILAKAEQPPDSPYLCRRSWDDFVAALARRGKLDELSRIKWLSITPMRTVQQSLFGEECQ